MTLIRNLPYDRKIGAAGAAPICIENSADALMDHLPVQGIPAGPSRTCRLYQGARRRLTAPGDIASLVGVRIRVGLILTWAVTRRCQGDGLGGDSVWLAFHFRYCGWEFRRPAPFPPAPL